MRRSVRARLCLLLIPLAVLFTAGAWLIYHNFGSALTGPLVPGCTESLPSAICSLQAALLPWLALGIGVLVLLWLSMVIFLLVLRVALNQLQENVLDFRKGHLQQLGDNLPAEMYSLVQQLDRILRASRSIEGQTPRSRPRDPGQRLEPTLDRPDPIFMESRPETRPRPAREPSPFTEPAPEPRPWMAAEPPPYTESAPRPRMAPEPRPFTDPAPEARSRVAPERPPYTEPGPEPHPGPTSEPPAARTQPHSDPVHPFVTRGRHEERRPAQPEAPEPAPTKVHQPAATPRPDPGGTAKPMATRERPPAPQPQPQAARPDPEAEPPVYMDPEPAPKPTPEPSPEPRPPEPEVDQTREAVPSRARTAAQTSGTSGDQPTPSQTDSYPALQCRKITTMLGSRYPHVNFELISDVSDHRSWPVAEGELKELFGQLLDNAGKWGRSQINVFLAIKANMLVFGVADDGPGVPPELVPSLGTEGFQANRNSPGKGVGLANVRKVVDRHGGSLTFDASRLGGLEVVATLPEASADEETPYAAHF